MNIDKIEKYSKVVSEINNFRDCYEDIKIWANTEGCVEASVILSWLIENPHMAEIANEISKLDNK